MGLYHTQRADDDGRGAPLVSNAAGLEPAMHVTCWLDTEGMSMAIE
jgi:hypothetical protein